MKYRAPLPIVAALVLPLACPAAHAALKGSWDFEEGTSATTTFESVTNTQSATFPSGVSIEAGGAGSGHTYFSDGSTGSYLDTNITGAALGITGAGSKTFTAFIRSSSLNLWDTGKYGIMSYSPTNGVTSGQDLRLAIDEVNGGLRFEVNSGFVAHSATGLDDGEWHMVAFVIEAGDNVGGVQLYLDGAFVGITSSSGTSTSINTAASATGSGIADFVIGGTQNSVTSGTQVFSGNIDGVRMYNSALTLGELNAIYATIPEPNTVLLGVFATVMAVAGRRRRLPGKTFGGGPA